MLNIVAHTYSIGTLTWSEIQAIGKSITKGLLDLLAGAVQM